MVIVKDINMKQLTNYAKKDYRVTFLLEDDIKIDGKLHYHEENGEVYVNTGCAASRFGMVEFPDDTVIALYKKNWETRSICKVTNFGSESPDIYDQLEELTTKDHLLEDPILTHIKGTHPDDNDFD